MNEKFNIIFAASGAVIGYLFGGLDTLLEVFCIILVLDTFTGMFKYYYKGEYQSKLFRKGLWKKCGYMLAVILAVQLDRLIGDTGALRSALLFCLIANEGTSIVENLGQIGVPFPETIINAIYVLKDKGEKNSNI
ncbi:phage holin family protein [Clostridium celatum]|uniref:phage holin family protein n=1 Tax=Clostridium celatum TaxID=36834 RepID=UPI001F1ECB19|nr:phage holin family protein [Clostridium celatum]MCE9654226.1 phage holin family protein [Clostridium celatum]